MRTAMDGTSMRTATTTIRQSIPPSLLIAVARLPTRTATESGTTTIATPAAVPEEATTAAGAQQATATCTSPLSLSTQTKTGLTSFEFETRSLSKKEKSHDVTEYVATETHDSHHGLRRHRSSCARRHLALGQ